MFYFSTRSFATRRSFYEKMLIFEFCISFYLFFGVKNLFLVNWIENEEISQTNTLYR